MGAAKQRGTYEERKAQWEQYRREAEEAHKARMREASSPSARGKMTARQRMALICLSMASVIGLKKHD